MEVSKDKEKIPFSKRSIFFNPIFYKTTFFVVLIDWVTKFIAHLWAVKENETTKDMLNRFHFGGMQDGWIIGFRKVEHYRSDEYPDYWSVGYQESGGLHDWWLNILEKITGQDLSPLWANTWLLIPLIPFILIQLFQIFDNSRVNKMLVLCSGLFLGAGIGNIGEAIIRGSVTDWLAVWFNDLPLFFKVSYRVMNFADLCAYLVFGVIIVSSVSSFFSNNKKEENPQT